MSANSVIVYYGIKFQIMDTEIEAIELRIDQRIVRARREGLKYYFGNFDGTPNGNTLFLGLEIGIFGIENQIDRSFSVSTFMDLIGLTDAKLDNSGIEGERKIYFKMHFDQ